MRKKDRLRFAVRGPGIPDASPRSHGTPCRDVPSRIHISVTGVSAGYAAEQGLALAAARCDVPARRAPLARECGMYLLDPPGCLVLQSAHQQTPTRPQDLAIQPSLVPDILAGRLGGTSRGRRHGLDAQVLDADHVEPAGYVRARFLSPVPASVSLASLESGDGPPAPCPVVRASPGPGQLPLKTYQPLAAPRAQSRHVQHFTCGQGGADCDAAVNADHRTISRRRNHFGDGGERDMPPACAVPGNPVRLHACRYVAGPAESYPPDLRYPHLPGTPVQPAHVMWPDSDDTEALIPLGLPPRRHPMSPGVEALPRLREVSQSLLLHHLGTSAEPAMLGAGRRELLALLQVTRRTVPARPPVRLLLHRQVPHVPSMSTVLPELGFPPRRRHETVTGHAVTLTARYDNYSPEGRERRFLAGRVPEPPRRNSDD